MVFANVNVTGKMKDLYDFNNPSDARVQFDGFARPARLAYIAQRGGTFAVYDYDVELEKYFTNGYLGI